MIKEDKYPVFVPGGTISARKANALVNTVVRLERTAIANSRFGVTGIATSSPRSRVSSARPIEIKWYQITGYGTGLFSIPNSSFKGKLIANIGIVPWELIGDQETEIFVASYSEDTNQFGRLDLSADPALGYPSLVRLGAPIPVIKYADGRLWSTIVFEKYGCNDDGTPVSNVMTRLGQTIARFFGLTK
ncbi:hypothetical protein C4588_07200 [Candidatus Parcubacteria bacterium]|nr:MAG: hypothetical protein C4588_07200 [Candidatus Parcubacteria bacterium]